MHVKKSGQQNNQTIFIDSLGTFNLALMAPEIPSGDPWNGRHEINGSKDHV
jgi:hypothetical protein